MPETPSRDALHTVERRIAEALPAIIFIASPHGEITYANRRWTTLTGLASDSSLAAGWASSVHPRDRFEARKRLRHALATGEDFHADFRVRTAEGDYRWFSASAIPFREDGKILRWYGVLTEIHDARTASAIVGAHALTAEHELTLDLQRALLPSLLPVLPGVTLSAYYSPAAGTASIGGDWYDAFALMGERIAFSIGDVAGHGTRAAMVMGEMRHTIRGAILEGVGVEDALSRANHFLFTHHPDVHVTAAAASYDVGSRRLRIANAGHPPPLLRRPDGDVEVSRLGGPALGVVSESVASVTEATFEPGSTLVFYTDGLIETRTDIIAGLKTLIAVVADMRTFDAESAHDIADRITPQRERQDDIAVLTVAVDANSP
jgi:PAS domain S-box-containing protein